MKDHSERNKKVVVNTNLPIIFVIDTSGGMHGRRLAILNRCLEDTINGIRELTTSDLNLSTQIGILQVNTGVQWAYSNGLECIEDHHFTPLKNGGFRDVGAALAELDQKLSKECFGKPQTVTKSPIIIFVTCGPITDNWYDPLRHLKKNEWYQKSIRIAFTMDGKANAVVFSDIVGNTGMIVENDSPDDFAESFKKVVLNCFLINGLLRIA